MIGIGMRMMMGAAGSGSSGGSSWDISNAVLNATKQILNPSDLFRFKDLFFKSDGSKLYLIDQFSNNRIYQYSLSTVWDISTITYDSKNFICESEGGLYFNADGLKLYVGGAGAAYGELSQYSLSTAWDISTAVLSATFNATSHPSVINGVVIDMSFSPDEIKLYLLIFKDGSPPQTLYQYTLGTAGDISTAVYDEIFYDNPNDEINHSCKFFLKNDGAKLYYFANFTSLGIGVQQYTLNTPWDISTTVYDNVFVLAEVDTIPGGIFFKLDGSNFFLLNRSIELYDYIL